MCLCERDRGRKGAEGRKHTLKENSVTGAVCSAIHIPQTKLYISILSKAGTTIPLRKAGP